MIERGREYNHVMDDVTMTQLGRQLNGVDTEAELNQRMSIRYWLIRSDFFMNNSSDLASIRVQRLNYYSNSIQDYEVEMDEIGECEEKELSSLDKDGTIVKNLQHIRGMN